MDAAPRFPIGPLEHVALASLGGQRCQTHDPGNREFDVPRIPVKHMAQLVGVSSRTWLRWQVEGGVPLWAADRAAVAIGRHPANIWPTFFDVDMEAS